MKDLKGGTIGVVGIKTATDLWARAGLINAGLVPDKDTKVVPMAFPVIGDAVRSGKVSAGTFVEPFYSAEMAKGGLRKLFTAVEAVGYDHELLDIFFGEKFLKANPDAVRAFLADYVAVTKYYLANTEQAKRDLHKAGFVRTPLEIYLKNADWKRDPNARVERGEPEEALHLHARQAAVAGEAGRTSTRWSTRATCRAERPTFLGGYSARTTPEPPISFGQVLHLRQPVLACAASSPGSSRARRPGTGSPGSTPHTRR